MFPYLIISYPLAGRIHNAYHTCVASTIATLIQWHASALLLMTRIGGGRHPGKLGNTAVICDLEHCQNAFSSANNRETRHGLLICDSRGGFPNQSCTAPLYRHALGTFNTRICKKLFAIVHPCNVIFQRSAHSRECDALNNGESRESDAAHKTTTASYYHKLFLILIRALIL